MTDPITLIRRKSQKLKRKLSTKHSSASSPEKFQNHSLKTFITPKSPLTPSTLLLKEDDYHHHNDYITKNTILSPTPNRHSVSFDLSNNSTPNLNIINNHSHNHNHTDNFDFYQSLNHSHKFYKTNGFHSVQNLPSYNNRLSLDETYYNNTHRDDGQGSDNLGTLINLPLTTNKKKQFIENTKRKSFDLSQLSFNNHRPKKRILSDISLTKSRPNSLIIDSTDHPFYSTGLNINNNIPNNNNAYPKNNNISSPTLNDSASFLPSSPILKSQSTSTILRSNSLHNSNSLHRKHSKKSNINNLETIPSNQIENSSNLTSILKSSNKNIGHSSKRYSHSYKNQNQNKNIDSLRNHKNQHTVTILQSNSLSIDLIFAIIFHILNIFFTICIYLPIYLVLKFSYISITLLFISIIIWYTNSYEHLIQKFIHS